MRLDHVSYAATPAGLDATAAELAQRLGVELIDGGVHPRFGTRNRILPLAGGHYLEVVAALDHPAADKVPFGQAVKARTESGGGWLGWVVAVDDLSQVEERLGRSAVDGHRTRPDGVELFWRQIGVKGLMNDPQLPFFVRWECDPSLHPSESESPGGHALNVDLASIEIAGDPARVTDWLGTPDPHPLDDVDVIWTDPDGLPGVQTVTFRASDGATVTV